MKTYSKEELNLIIENHGKWLRDEDGGTQANLSGADLSRADLRGADLKGADLKGANLSWSDLRRANLSRANLNGANLNGADLKGADLKGANLSWANLSRANLSRADLRRAYLSGADLYNTIGEKTHIKSGQIETYLFAYTDKHLQIGCERHLIEDWWSFDDEKILLMEGKKALEFWKKWKPVLRQIIEMSPALPTGHKNEP